jgi:hypothetical protein
MHRFLPLIGLFLAVTVHAQMSVTDQHFSIRPSYNSSSATEDKRFQSCENTGGSGFFWIDTATGDLWKTAHPELEWIFLGSPRGASSGRKGTYQLLSDRKGGVYILNTDNGEGWWTDGSSWKIIGELSRRTKKSE